MERQESHTEVQTCALDRVFSAPALESIRNTDDQHIRTASPGDGWWQGDLCLQFLGAAKPDINLNVVEKPRTQLAEGSSPGARHNLTLYEGLVCHDLADTHPLVGYVMLCPQGVEVTHPEHGNIKSDEPGWYAARFQRQHAEEMRRAMD